MRVPGDSPTEVVEPAAPLRIFINYRRGPSTPYARQLYEELSQRFGVTNVFWDIDTIQPGTDFVEFLRRAVGSCQVMVSVIGPGWLEAVDRDGARRLDNPEDFVRVELEAALERDVRIIPVLVGEATVPRSNDLPTSLAPFVRRNAMEVTDSRWDYDVGRLLHALDRIAEEERQKAEEPRPLGCRPKPTPRRRGCRQRSRLPHWPRPKRKLEPERRPRPRSERGPRPNSVRGQRPKRRNGPRPKEGPGRCCGRGCGCGDRTCTRGARDTRGDADRDLPAPGSRP